MESSIINKINGQYLKFYFTQNPELPELLKNSGAIIVLQEIIDTSSESSLLDKAYVDNCKEQNILPYIYSLWVCNTKILSGYGLYNNSKDFINAKLYELLNKIDNKVDKNDGYISIKSDISDNQFVENYVPYNSLDNSLLDYDKRCNISDTYFISNNKAINTNDLYNYIQKQITEYHSIKELELHNIVFVIEYYKNSYCSELSYKTIQCDQAFYYDKIQDILSIPTLYIPELSNDSIIYKISIQFNVSFPINEDTNIENNNYSIKCLINNDSTKSFVSGEYTKNDNKVNIINSSIINQQVNNLSNNKLSAELVFNFNDGTYKYVYLPILSFNQEPLHNILFSNTIGLKYTTNNNIIISGFSELNYMYNLNNTNTYLYDYKIINNNNAFNNINRSNDRFYFLVRSNSCIREIYVKPYNTTTAYNINYFINITNKVYLYNDLKYTDKDNNTYIIYGCNFNDIIKNFNNNTVNNVINRLAIKICTDYNIDIELGNTNITENNFNSDTFGSHWTKDNNNTIIPNTSITYLSSTEYDTTNWSEQEWNNQYRNYNFIS